MHGHFEPLSNLGIYTFMGLKIYFGPVLRRQKEQLEVLDFNPLNKFLNLACKEFEGAIIHIDYAERFPDSKEICMVRVRAEYTNPDGSQGYYGLDVTPDFATTIYLFKVTASETTVNPIEGFEGNGYYILSSVKPRISVGRMQALCPTSAGLFRGEETVEEARLRKWEVETSCLQLPQDVSKDMKEIPVLHDQPMTFSSTMKGNVLVRFMHLDLGKPDHLVFWQNACGRKGGDLKKGESTALQFVKLEKFLAQDSDIPVAARSGLALAAIALLEEEPALSGIVRRSMPTGVKTPAPR